MPNPIDYDRVDALSGKYRDAKEAMKLNGVEVDYFNKFKIEDQKKYLDEFDRS